MMLWTAFVVGLVGSLHCVGMCSPLALAATRLSPHVLANRAFYNSGRIATYGALGAVVAGIGTLASLTRYEVYLGGLMGVALIAVGLTGATFLRIPFLTPLLQRLSSALRGLFVDRLRRAKSLTMFSLGMINGLLPCGLTYLALTYCIILSADQGIAFMISFGAGTLPAMVGVPFLGDRLLRKVNLSRLVSVVMVILGLLMLVRTGLYDASRFNRSLSGQSEEVVCP